MLPLHTDRRERRLHGRKADHLGHLPVSEGCDLCAQRRRLITDRSRLQDHHNPVPGVDHVDQRAGASPLGPTDERQRLLSVAARALGRGISKVPFHVLVEKLGDLAQIAAPDRVVASPGEFDIGATHGKSVSFRSIVFDALAPMISNRRAGPNV